LGSEVKTSNKTESLKKAAPKKRRKDGKSHKFRKMRGVYHFVPHINAVGAL
jgi:hypothetical protein